MATHLHLPILLVISFVLAVCRGAAVVPRISDSHNINQCITDKAKVALLETEVYEPAKFLSFAKRIINYPDVTVSPKIITCIKVTNTDTSDRGGYPKIVSGGVGATDVQILLTSQFGQPLSFRIEIWAAS